MIRVLIVDDHPVVRRGIVDMLAGDPTLDPVGQAASYEELWDALLENLKTQAGIADMGPILPMLSNLEGDELERVRHAASDLLASESGVNP